jgi:hypothetical protein
MASPSMRHYTSIAVLPVGPTTRIGPFLSYPTILQPASTARILRPAWPRYSCVFDAGPWAFRLRCCPYLLASGGVWASRMSRRHQRLRRQEEKRRNQTGRQHAPADDVIWMDEVHSDAVGIEQSSKICSKRPRALARSVTALRNPFEVGG